MQPRTFSASSCPGVFPESATALVPALHANLVVLEKVAVGGQVPVYLPDCQRRISRTLGSAMQHITWPW